MANARTHDLASMGPEDLMDELQRMQQELLNLRFQFATHQATNYARISILKRDVARIKTLLRERELEVSAV